LKKENPSINDEEIMTTKAKNFTEESSDIIAGNNFKKRKNPILSLMKWGDFVLIAVVLVICGLLWGKLILGFSQKGQVAEIVVKGKVVLRYDLETQKKIFELPDINNALESFAEEKKAGSEVVSDESSKSDETWLHVASIGIHFDILLSTGMVRFQKSDCPDQICVHTGFISKPGQVSACIPAQVLVRITGDTSNNDVDVIIS